MPSFPPLMPVYERLDFYASRGEGAYLFNDQGERFLDCMSGIAVTALGHCHPYITVALKKQAETLWTASNLLKTHSGERLAQRLVDLSFADTVFFQNSGVEAWECGAKTTRKYFSAIGKPQRDRFISFKGCFHGRSMTAIAASKTEKMVKGFGPLIDAFDQVPWEDISAVRAAVTERTAAIVIEPVIGEGGIKVAAAEFLQALRAVCDEHGLLLFFDEIQCGMGRTGKLFAYEWAGITPDVMCIAKALGNGFPIGACLATAKAAQGMTKGTHGSTYGGNPLATEVGNAVLDVMTEAGFLDEVVRKGHYLSEGLQKVVSAHPSIYSAVRGVGLIQGLIGVVENKIIIEALRREKLLSVEANENVVRLLPPLIISYAQIDEMIEMIDRAANKLEQKS